MKNFISMTIVILFTVFCLTACGGTNMIAPPQQNPDLTPDISTPTPPPPAADLLPPDGDVSSIKVLYNRIDWRENMDNASIIRSVDDLHKFSESLEAVRKNGIDEDLIWRLTGEQYDDAFFAEHVLVMITVSESSGSNRHELMSITEDNGVLNINIDRLTPEIGTADMAGWLITIELSNDYSANDINVIFSDVPV